MPVIPARENGKIFKTSGRGDFKKEARSQKNILMRRDEK